MYSADNDLLPGEKLLWSGSPTRRRYFVAEDLLTLIAVAVWLAFALTIAGANSQGDGFGPPQIFSIVAGVVACHFVFGLPLLRYLKLGRTTYLVTDRRVVARTSFLGGKERSAYLEDLSPPLVRPAAEGTGTITFGELSLFALLNAGHGMPAGSGRRESAMLLVSIEDPTRVRDLIATATEATRRHSTAPGGTDVSGEQ